jgi:cysteine-rich repeat protein
VGAMAEDCDADCTEVECGDEVVNWVAGEQCDDGNNDNNDACSNQCRINSTGGSGGAGGAGGAGGTGGTGGTAGAAGGG